MLPHEFRLEAKLIHENFLSFFKMLACYVEEYETHSLVYSTSTQEITDINNVLSTNCVPEKIEGLIEEVIKKFQELKLPFHWWVMDLSLPYNLKQKLLEKRFKKSAEYKGMICNLNKLTLPQCLKPHSRLDIQIVETQSQFEHWLKWMEQCSNMPKAGEKTLFRAFRQHLNSKKFIHYRIFHQNEFVGAASLFCDDKTAGIYNFRLLPQFEEGEAGIALLTRLLCDIKLRGYDYAIQITRPRWVALSNQQGFQDLLSYQSYLLHFHESALLSGVIL